MSYLKEAEEIIRDLFYESWMDEDDWKKFLIEIEKQGALSLEKFSDELEKGLNSGHSIEKQKEALKYVWNIEKQKL